MPQKALRYSEHTLFMRLRDKAFHTQNGLCFWCKVPMVIDAGDNKPNGLSGDHIVPRSHKGETVAGNVVAACRYCNGARKVNEDYALSFSSGEEQHHSPFECLAVLKTKEGDNENTS